MVLPGDGIGTSNYVLIVLMLSINSTSSGPEVVAEAVRVLEVISAASKDVELKLESHEFGGCAIDSTGQPLPDSTLKACQEADAILMGECLSSSTTHA